MKTLRDQYIKLNEHERLYGIKNPLVGLTGGIATGKSSVGNYLRNKGLKLIDADKLVHEIYSDPKTLDIVSHLSPESIKDGQISFKDLRIAFFNSDQLKKELENFIYARLPDQFLSSMPNNEKEVIIYEVPLLFEKNLQEHFDLIMVTSCTLERQRERLQSRDHIDDQSALKIIQAQWPLKKKESKADFLIKNVGTFSDLERKSQNFIDHYLV